MSDRDTTGQYLGNIRAREQPLKYKLLKQNIQLNIELNKQCIYGVTELILLPLTHKLKLINIDCHQHNIHIDHISIDHVTTTYQYSTVNPIHQQSIQCNDIKSIELKLCDSCDIHDRLGGNLQVKIPKQTRDTLKTTYIQQYQSNNSTNNHHNSHNNSSTPNNDNIDIDIINTQSSGHNINTQQLFLPSLLLKIYYTIRYPVCGIQFSPSHYSTPHTTSNHHKSSGDEITHCYTESSINGYSASCWVPCMDRLNERCNYEIEFIHDVEYTVLCTGELIHSNITQFNQHTKKSTKYIVYENLVIHSIGWSVGLYDIIDIKNYDLERLDFNIQCNIYIPIHKSNTSIRSNTTQTESYKKSLVQLYTEHIYKMIYYIQIYCSTDYTYKSIHFVYVHNMSNLNNQPYVLHTNLILYNMYDCCIPLSIDTVVQQTQQLCYNVLYAWLSSIIYIDNYIDLWYWNGITQEIAYEYCKSIYGDNTVEWMLYTIKYDLGESESPIIDIIQHNNTPLVDSDTVIDFTDHTSNTISSSTTPQNKYRRQRPIQQIRYYDITRNYLNEYDQRHIYNLGVLHRAEYNTAHLQHKYLIVVNLLHKLFKLNKTIFIQLLHEYSTINTSTPYRQSFNIHVLNQSYCKQLIHGTQISLYCNVIEQYVYCDAIPLFSCTTELSKQVNSVNTQLTLEIDQNKTNVHTAYRTYIPLRIQLYENQHSTLYSAQHDGSDLLLTYELHHKSKRGQSGSELYYILVDMNNVLLRTVEYHKLSDNELIYGLQHESTLYGQIQLYVYLLHHIQQINSSLVLVDHLVELLQSDTLYIHIQCILIDIYSKLLYFDNNGYEVWGYTLIFDRVRTMILDSNGLVRYNNFTNFKSYYILKQSLYSLLHVKRNHVTPDNIVELIITILRENNNTYNQYTDQYYLSDIFNGIQCIRTESGLYKSQLYQQCIRYITIDSIQCNTQLTCTIINTLIQLHMSQLIDMNQSYNIIQHIQQLYTYPLNIQLCWLTNLHRLCIWSPNTYFTYILDIMMKFNELPFTQQYHYLLSLNYCMRSSKSNNDTMDCYIDSLELYQQFIDLLHTISHELVLIELTRLYYNIYGTKPPIHISSAQQIVNKQIINQQLLYYQQYEQNDITTVYHRRLDSRNELYRIRDKRNLHTGKVKLGGLKVKS